MGFKSDREFLRNVSIGAVGTRKVASVLGAGGFQIIELERYSSSNKIWATKIKRLRVPDLLCLRTGIRIESRGKSALEVTMSHAVSNPDRAWDKGLRDSDLIAFVKCWPNGESWRASDRVVLFAVGEMRATADRAGLSQMKSAAEGSEIRLTWPATVPGNSGKVTSVTPDRIETLLSTGRKQAYRLARKGASNLLPYVQAGDTFGEDDTVIASVMPHLIPAQCPNVPQYDFLADLSSPLAEDVYVAVKALGFLPDLKARSVGPLLSILNGHADVRVRLEAAASLARLENEQGWTSLKDAALSKEIDAAYRMEASFILAELPGDRPPKLLLDVATDATNDSELRASAIWGLSKTAGALFDVLRFADDADELTAVHAIVGGGKLIADGNVAKVLRAIGDGDRKAAGIVRLVLSGKGNFLPEAVAQLRDCENGKRRNWLLYLIAAAGRQRCASISEQLTAEDRRTLEFFWTHNTDNWTNRLDVADQINFLEQQSS